MSADPEVVGLIQEAMRATSKSLHELALHIGFKSLSRVYSGEIALVDSKRRHLSDLIMAARGHAVVSPLIAKAASLSLLQFPIKERVELLRALSLILPEPEAEDARHTAFMLEKCEEQQIKFLALMEAAK